MIKNRIASAAALFTFGFAALGGTVLAVAAPANADAGTTTTTSSSQTSGDKFTPQETLPGTAGPAVADAEQVSDELQAATRGPNVAPVPAPGTAATQEHVPFPHIAAPHSEHNGQGHKGGNNGPHKTDPRRIADEPKK